jgi:hypothetical protein
VTPTLNIFRTDHRAEVWLRVGSVSRDLEIREVRTQSLGCRPDWLDIEVGENGWADILDAHDEVEWALREGLCPRQCFKVRVRFRWFRSGGYYDPEEWDCDIDWEIVEREPIGALEAARRWEAWLR